MEIVILNVNYSISAPTFNCKADIQRIITSDRKEGIYVSCGYQSIFTKIRFEETCKHKNVFFMIVGSKVHS